ncbi:hypothetical protein [Leminorella grimontii]|uniref:hypothetical protein n=1 Tax=Leminorella grimontii TaxID=82981 RepID=UPI003220330B
MKRAFCGFLALAALLLLGGCGDKDIRSPESKVLQSSPEQREKARNLPHRFEDKDLRYEVRYADNWGDATVDDGDLILYRLDDEGEKYGPVVLVSISDYDSLLFTSAASFGKEVKKSLQAEHGFKAVKLLTSESVSWYSSKAIHLEYTAIQDDDPLKYFEQMYINDDKNKKSVILVFTCQVDECDAARDEAMLIFHSFRFIR